MKGAEIMTRDERHQVRDAIDAALSKLRGIPFEPPPDIEEMLQNAESLLRRTKERMVEVYS